MNVRKSFDLELKQLRDQLLNMAELAQKALDKAIYSLQHQDLQKAKQVLDEDNVINQMELDINNKAIAVMAKQAPVASDLRRIVVAIKISSDVERIGDLAVNIAKSTLRIGDQPLIKPIEDIPKMMQFVQQMLLDAVTAFYSEDVNFSKEIAAKDDTVDEMYGKIITELMELMAIRTSDVKQITELSFICRNIERVGDHITNISENIIYLVTGHLYDLNH
ncbi:phosphate signaling complex protein PhoU [Priestia koreensis]|uniref:Phosphate-specific transport system accessory protein PhoU n=1 Tax=Priestia koreensis TaxID=284581 RepID=A0A0M0KZ60_9BACI|nr:phosphate signaling complex protein PhoU [Priestia koreensis]KOO43912.1 PhoU family transcriptional regulator [Priestia koreensis]MCM3002488.1 phosphate signaling complex protein PhoU [Priestia koreensis]UNL84204.1 phosphate signaling complex protein PhoU [Priestia koreensis]